MVDTIKLENGLTLELLDRSRPIAGDRWFVSFVARIQVRVELGFFAGAENPHVPFEDVLSAVGEKTVYRHEKVRNFIGENEKDEVFNGLKEHFLSASLGYLSRPEFPGRLILREYRRVRGGCS